MSRLPGHLRCSQIALICEAFGFTENNPVSFRQTFWLPPPGKKWERQTRLPGERPRRDGFVLMVEVAGIEPASEKAPTRASTSLAQVLVSGAPAPPSGIRQFHTP